VRERQVRTVQIISYDAFMAVELTNHFNAAVAGVPHCYPVESSEMETALTPAAQGDDKHLEAESVIVARSNGAIFGFAHFGIRNGDEKNPERTGIIRFLHFERGQRAVGQALLEAVQDDLRQHQVDRINAFSQRYRYRFYGFNHAYLSNHLDHVEALLGYNEYEKAGGEVFLDSINYIPQPPASINLQFDIAVEWIDGPGARQDLTLRAVDGDRQLGECQSVSCQTFSRNEALKDWHFCNWLGVEEEIQGKGLGRHLLQQARLELHKVGYRHAGISTAWQNYRAFQFYSNDGYRLSDWTYAWAKDGLQ
jgi:GNAT superfamily N-acetyltransferase